MKLKSLRIENFKSVEDSGVFNVSQISCLVGKNEAGKSSLLQALNKLNPIEKDDAEFDDILEYPRRKYSEYEETKKEKPANVITSVWILEEQEISTLNMLLGKDSLTNSEIIISKGYKNTQYWNIKIDETKIVKHYINKYSFEAIEGTPLKSANNIASLIEVIGKLQSPTEKQSQLLAELNKNFPKKNINSGDIINILSQFLPKFLYFPSYNDLPGQVSINDLIARVNRNDLRFGDKLFLALLRQAGTSPEELQALATFEHLKAKLEAVSNKISEQIFKYWSQNKHLEVEFSLGQGLTGDQAPFNQGLVFRIRVKNTMHKVSVSFDNRSTGFIWFFSFLIWLSQVKNNYGNNLFILLDEPGLSLHGKAQEDLLRFFIEKLKPLYQVIYTTHSPFMVDPNNLMSVKTVEDIVKEGQLLGTKVGDKVLSTDRDTIFPLQAALGYDIAQSLFVGKNNLLVEGPSDLLYIKWFSGLLSTKKRCFLDPHWVIVPCGGIDKIGSFVALFGGNKLNIAVLTDYHKGDKQKVRDLRESELLKSGHVFSAEMFVKQDQADIEDILGEELYIHLVNKCYDLKGKNKIERKSSTASVLILDTIKEHFATLPPEYLQFDHYFPASYLMENSAVLVKELPGLEEALGRFEEIFKNINPFLLK